jgi:hypothetical protein
MTVVTKLPIARLTTTRGEARRVGDVGAEDIRDLLRAGAVRFVIADVGTPLRWVPESECFETWTREVKPHLEEPEQPVYLEELPGQYAYFASRWDDGSGPIILLSKSH